MDDEMADLIAGREQGLGRGAELLPLHHREPQVPVPPVPAAGGGTGDEGCRGPAVGAIAKLKPNYRNVNET